MLEMIFTQILKMSVTAGICIIVVSLLHLMFYRIPRKYLYALWIVVAFRLICPVSINTPVGLVPMGNVGQTSVTDELTQSEQAVGDAQESTGDAQKTVDPQVTGTMQGESANGQQSSAAQGNDTELAGGTTSQNNMTDTASDMRTDTTANDQPLLPLLSRIWLAGMFFALTYLLYSYGKTKRRLSHAVLAENTTSDRLIHTGWNLAPVYECDELPSPFAMGIFHPVIYIPFGLEASRREMILLHEQYHIRRRDHLVKLFASILLAVYWFHPLVWLSWVILCRDMEMSCDEKVLELLGSEQRKAYSLTLLQFASGEPAGYVPLGFGEPNVKSRIKHVLKFKKAAVGTGVVGVVIIITAILLLGSNRQQKNGDSANAGIENNADETQSDGATVSDAATLLYSVKNPYVGDISADGKVLRAIEEVRPGSVYAGKTELQTSEEPYEYHFLLEQNGETLKVQAGDEESKLNQEMSKTAVLMLALIDNLGEVQWNYAVVSEYGTTNDVLYTSYVDIDRAQQWLGVDNIKSYAESPEKVQELLELVETVSGDATDESTSIASAYLANVQKVWYSPVKMMILPDGYDMMSEGEKQCGL